MKKQQQQKAEENKYVFDVANILNSLLLFRNLRHPKRWHNNEWSFDRIMIEWRQRRDSACWEFDPPTEWLRITGLTRLLA